MAVRQGVTLGDSRKNAKDGTTKKCAVLCAPPPGAGILFGKEKLGKKSANGYVGDCLRSVAKWGRRLVGQLVIIVFHFLRKNLVHRRFGSVLQRNYTLRAIIQ